MSKIPASNSGPIYGCERRIDPDMGEGVVVPVGAVLPTGKHNIVFVAKGEGRLEPRFIKLGRKFGEFYEVKRVEGRGTHRDQRKFSN